VSIAKVVICELSKYRYRNAFLNNFATLNLKAAVPVVMYNNFGSDARRTCPNRSGSVRIQINSMDHGYIALSLSLRLRVDPDSVSDFLFFLLTTKVPLHN
jgi:hypothetical protein